MKLKKSLLNEKIEFKSPFNEDIYFSLKNVIDLKMDKFAQSIYEKDEWYKKIYNDKIIGNWIKEDMIHILY